MHLGDCLESRDRIFQPIEPNDETVFELSQPFHHCRDEDVLFGLEIIIHRAFSDSGCLGNLADTGGPVSLLREQHQGGAGDIAGFFCLVNLAWCHSMPRLRVFGAIH